MGIKKTEEELESTIQEAVSSGRTISMKTYLLSDYGENVLKVIVRNILTKYNRMDLMEISYSSAKELVINATKANLKRALFKMLNLDITNPEHYDKGISQFKSHLSEEKLNEYKELFKKYELPVMATFYYSEDVLNIKVKNSFPLLPVEEERIRDKFDKATSFSSLIDFFMEYGDSTEGAGMGLTMVGILLDESKIDKHSFSLYSSNKYKETIAKIEIPLHDSYIPKRKKFEMELKEKNISPEELRKTFNYNYKHFTKDFKKN